MSNRKLGPIHSATIVCADLEEITRAYCDFLQLNIKDIGIINPIWAKEWNCPNLSGLKYCGLGHPEDNESWLRFIEDPESTATTALSTFGWMSLEINVNDVDVLATQLNSDYFTVIGEPADLDISDNIRAMQVQGKSGEVLYLTTIKAPCPPFELPLTERFVDKIFIPVLSTNNRESSLDFYQKLANETGLIFDTKITVLNNKFDKPESHNYPVATLQLNNDALIEIDEVDTQINRAKAPCGLVSGISVLSFYSQTVETNTIMTGPGGELIELVNGNG